MHANLSKEVNLQKEDDPQNEDFIKEEPEAS